MSKYAYECILFVKLGFVKFRFFACLGFFIFLFSYFAYLLKNLFLFLIYIPRFACFFKKHRLKRNFWLKDRVF